MRSSNGQLAGYAADTNQVKRFYYLAGQRTPWLLKPVVLQQLQQTAKQSTDWGTPLAAFPVGFVDSVIDGSLVLNNSNDSSVADLRLTAVAINLFAAMAFGTGPSPVAYEGTKPLKPCIDIALQLAAAVHQGQLSGLLSTLEPAIPLYLALRDTLRTLVKQTTNLAAEEQLTREDQLRHNKIDALRKSLNTVRWMHCQFDSTFVLVNIPSATLQYYEQGKLLLSSKVIVGKPSTPSGTLSSEIKEVILYPYWTVPAKIASRELLPQIKRNPGFLQTNGYQVLSKGKIIDATTIDWSKYNSRYFPFTLRQSTGCDNSMGIIKFNFYSPFGIFLHDTPWKVLYNAPSRYLSHGCIRVEKINELAHLLLKDDSVLLNAILDQGDSLNTVPTQLPLKKPARLIIVYETAWTDIDGSVRYYKDIYHKNEKASSR